MGTNIAPEHAPPLGRNGDHLLPVGGQGHRFPHPWIVEWRLRHVHHKRIPPRAWPKRHDRVGEIPFQDVGLGRLEMATDPRHGELPGAERGKDPGQIGHDHRLVLSDVRQTRLPVVRVTLGPKLHPRRIRFEFERPGTDQEFGVFAVHLFGDASLHHHGMRPCQHGQQRR